MRSGLTALRLKDGGAVRRPNLRRDVMERTKKDDFIFPFEKLEVWQLAIEFADFILGLLETFPTNKHLRLVGQMEAAVCSIAQNTRPPK